MGMIQLNRPLIWPGNFLHAAGSPATAISAKDTLDASGEFTALVFMPRETMVVTHVLVIPQAVSGSPTCEVRLETVDANGNSTGTLVGTNTNGVSGTLTAGAGAVVALTAPATLNPGTPYALVIQYASGTSFATGQFTNHGHATTLPYTITNTSGSQVKSPINTARIAAALMSGAASYYRQSGLVPALSLSSSQYNTGTATDISRGARFKIPFRCRVCGITHFNLAQTGNFNFSIRDDAGAELNSSSTLYDEDYSGGGTVGLDELFFDNPVVADPSTFYRADLKPTTANNISLYYITAYEAAARNALPGGQANWSWYQDDDTTGIDDTQTARHPFFDLLIDQIDWTPEIHTTLL